MNKNKKAFIDGKTLYTNIGKNTYMRTPDIKVGSHKIASVYKNGYKESDVGEEFPENYEFAGIIVDGCFYGSSKYLELNDKNTNTDIYEYQASVKKQLIADFVKTATDEYAGINACTLNDVSKRSVENDIKNGCMPISDDVLKELILQLANDTAANVYNEKNIKTLLDNTIMKKINEKLMADFKKAAGRKMAINSLMIKLTENGVSDETTIRQVLKAMKDSNVKYVTATFNFGYCKIGEKISTDINSWHILPTQVATYAFEQKYIQPYVSNSTSYEKFIPFIEKITYMRKTIFERNLKFDDISKRQLYNLVSRTAKEDGYNYALSYTEKLVDQACVLLESGDIVFTDKDSERTELLSILYHTRTHDAPCKKLAKMLIEHGYDPQIFLNNDENDKNERAGFIK